MYLVATYINMSYTPTLKNTHCETWFMIRANCIAAPTTKAPKTREDILNTYKAVVCQTQRYVHVTASGKQTSRSHTRTRTQQLRLHVKTREDRPRRKNAPLYARQPSNMNSFVKVADTVCCNQALADTARSALISCVLQTCYPALYIFLNTKENIRGVQP